MGTLKRIPANRHSRWWLRVLIAAGFVSPAIASTQTCDPPDSGLHAELEIASAERFRRARSMAQDGNYEEAIREYRYLSSRHHDNVDYLFGEAQTRFWSGDQNCALHLLKTARRLAPRYEALWQLEYQILASAGQKGSRARLDAFRKAANAQFPGAAWLRTEQSKEPVAWRWEAGFDRESLDNGAPDWQYLYAHVNRRSPEGHLLALTVSERRRFSLSDNELAIAGAFKLTEDWVINGGLTLNPDSSFLPAAVLEAGASRQIGGGWVAGGSLRFRDYAEQNVISHGLRVERYFGRFRAAYHLDNTRLSSTTALTHRGVLNYYDESGAQFGITLAAGEEVEIIAPGQLLKMDINAFAVTGRHPLTGRLNVVWRLGTHRQGSLYRRNSLGVSIAGDF